MVRNITCEDRNWLMENYPHMPNKQCLKHLHCGYPYLRQLVKDCGFAYKVRAKVDKPKPVKKCEWEDANAKGYCIDCSHYRQGGECDKRRKSVGALWKKRCFSK